MANTTYQIVSALILHFNCLALGLIYSWPSCVLLLFTSEETPLNRPMGEAEISLLGSLPAIGGLVGNLVVGLNMDRLGRKNSALVTAILGTVSWAFIIFSNRTDVILVSTFVAGLSGPIFLVVPVFISEFSEESIRGALTSGAIVFYGLGMFLTFVLGGILSYQVMIYTCTLISAIGVVLIWFLKESPVVLLQKGLEEDAKKSIAFYRNASINSKIVEEDIEKIKRSLNSGDVKETPTPEQHKLLTVEEQVKKPTQKLSLWKFLRNSRSSRRALLVSLTLSTASIFQGLVVVLMYAKPLFNKAVDEEVLSSTWCCAFLALITVVMGLAAAYLTDRAGRRTLMLYSSVISGIFCIALGTQIHLDWGPRWLIAAFIYLFCASYTFGAGTVPYVLLAELFLPEVKGVLSMVVLEWTWLCSFIVLFIFNPLVSAIGLGPVFYLFAAICFLTAVFSFFFQPETTGLTVDAIQERLVKKWNDQSK